MLAEKQLYSISTIIFLGGEMSIGWKILKTGDYILDLPRLSSEEEKTIEDVEHKFKEATRNKKLETKKESQEILRGLLLDQAKESSVYLESEQVEYLSKMAVLHIYGFCFLEPLLEDNEIEEISVIGTNKPAYVYLRNKGWRSVNAEFSNESAISDVVNKMARGLGRHITIQNPRLDAMLPDGSRLHATLKPVSNGEITIRKFREKPFSPPELITHNTLDAKALALLSLIMQGDNSVLIAGNTASGKTTTMNALFSFVPANERILIAEQTPEINIPHEHQLRLVANSDMGISLKDLVYDSLRMRPDRMIVGEIRNKEEAEALFDVLLAGQARGSYATFHAQSAEEALSRLATLGISKMDMRSIDCIVVQRRMLTYDLTKRKTKEIRRIIEIAHMDDLLETVFSHNKKKDVLEAKKLDSILEKNADKLGMKLNEIKDELKRREKIFMKNKLGFADFYCEIQNNLYGLGVKNKSD
jgi:Flp pilus assembly CpaF family ATPase